eukprot:TRINITY_DN2820_c0_g1_i1.p1 TRINITY_DN2820_c0_g1~~TRINITY_DN2820_c0_g1_i1.p1  ORF type:complete len:360 (+),score=131.38 TRINITY_DN2820_c0_g1_i1:109-1188(+)
MSTHALASAIFPLPIEEVWKELSDFSSAAKLLPSHLKDCTLEFGDARGIGAIRKLEWDAGEWRRQRLLSMSDQFHFLSWELIEAHPPVETSAILSKIRCLRISETNQTLVEWSAEFGSDVPPSFVAFEQKSYQDNLIEMREVITGHLLPTLFHKNEAPSTRVLWLAHEIGIPLRVHEVVEAPTNLRKSTEMAMNKGGIVTSFEDGHLTMLESGAIILYLLEKHDLSNKFSPPLGTLERALFLKFVFYSSSTADHLLFSAYKLMYVVGMDEEDEEIMSEFDRLKSGWDNDVALNFERQLEKHPYICGDKFTAADVMLGWTIFMANLLGWLEFHPLLTQYLERLQKRPSYQAAFNNRKFQY